MMYYFASKIAWIFLQPSTLMIWGTVIGLALLLTPLAQLGRRLALVAGGFLAICGLTPICVILIRPLEDRFPSRSYAEIQDPKGIIALGGALNASLTRARGPIAMDSAGARVTEALALMHYFPKARLVFSGGSGDLLDAGIPEGDVVEEFISELGLPMDRVTIERKSRNTFENARFTSDLVQPKAGELWVLVTSAFHMPRAVASFKKAGFHVAPYPVDYFTSGDQLDYWVYTFNPLKSLPLTDTAAKEWLGLTAYWFLGKTAEFLPQSEISQPQS